jgi:hypothetical protein
VAGNLHHRRLAVNNINVIKNISGLDATDYLAYTFIDVARDHRIGLFAGPICWISHANAAEFLFCPLVLVNDSFLHHEYNMFRLPDVFNGIAGDANDVGHFSGF